MFNRIKYFLKAAKTGSFTKAANEMYISPQALTKQIAVLEKELGGKLFDRKPSGVTLTDLGKFAYDRFSEIDSSLSFTLEQIKNRTKKKINIGFFYALPKEQIITPLITHLIVNYSDYQIGFELIEMAAGREKLERGEIDFLVTNTSAEEKWDNCRLLSFFETVPRVVVSMNHPWVMKEKITEDDMHRMIFYKQSDPGAKSCFDTEDCFYENIPCRSVKCVPNFSTLMELLKIGDGFAVFPLVFENAEKEKIKSFEYPGKTIVFHTALVYDKNNASDHLVKMADDIKNEFGLHEIRS